MSVEMKDSGIAWIGEIPKHWEVEKIKRLLRNKSIKNKANEQVLSLYRDYGIVPKNSRDDNHNVTSEDTSTYKFVEDGDFVVNKMKAWQGSMAVSSFRGIISPAYHVFSFLNTEIDKMYIHYLLRDESYKPEYMRLSTGLRVGQWDLSVDDFLNILFVCPPKEEQSRIANFLDKKCAEIDELIALQDQMIAQLTTYKQAVITETVTKGLDPNVKMKDSGVEWIGEIPEHWEIRRIKYIGKAENGLTYGPSDVCDEGQGILVLRSSNIQNGKLTFEDNVFVRQAPKSLIVNKGDIIICSRNGSASLVGKSALVEDDNLNATFGAFMMRFRSIADCIYTNFLLTAAVSQYKQLFSTTTVNQLTIGIFGNLAMPYIDNLQEQQSIANHLDQKCKEIDELISIKKDKIEQLKAYKKSVIFEYVTGKKHAKI